MTLPIHTLYFFTLLSYEEEPPTDLPLPGIFLYIPVMAVSREDAGQNS